MPGRQNVLTLDKFCYLRALLFMVTRNFDMERTLTGYCELESTPTK